MNVISPHNGNCNGTAMPLLKKSPSESPSNYRPISLLSSVGKLQERIIFKHIFNFFLTNNLIHRHQSGFLPGHSTVYQLICIIKLSRALMRNSIHVWSFVTFQKHLVVFSIRVYYLNYSRME